MSETESRLTLSVIIPARNASETLEACLRGVKESERDAFEVIVVDDASEDATGDIARRAGARVLRTAKAGGQGAAKNLGVKEARGDVYVFIDSDVVLHRETLEKAATYFEAHPDVGAVTGRLNARAPVRGFFSRYKNTYMEYMFSLLPDRVDFLYTSIAAVRRERFIPFTERAIKADDTELGTRMRAAGVDIAFLPDMKVDHLKEYTPLSFVKNNFQVPYDWGKIFMQRAGWRSLGGGRFAHASLGQIAGLVAAPLTILALALTFWGLPIWVPLAGLAVMILLNARFLSYIIRRQGILFGLAATGVALVDPLIMCCGVGTGMVAWCGKAISRGRGQTDDGEKESV